MFNVPPQYELKKRNENNLVNYLLLSVKKVNVNYFCFDSLSLLELSKTPEAGVPFSKEEVKARSASLCSFAFCGSLVTTIQLSVDLLRK